MTGSPAVISEGGTKHASGALGSSSSSFLQEKTVRAINKTEPHTDTRGLMV
jgi:hypothetical protein